VTEGGGEFDFRGPESFSTADLYWANMVGSASNAIVVPDRLSASVRFDAAFPAYQDWDFFLQCNRHGRVTIVPEVLCEYIQHAGPERLTNQLEKRLRGHELLMDRHRDAMTPACVAYHKARMRVLASTSRAEKLRLAPRLLRDTPGVALRALLIESVHGRIGRMTGDPGRAMRQLQKLAAGTRPAGDSQGT
jgi:hypothetical protein